MKKKFLHNIFYACIALGLQSCFWVIDFEVDNGTPTNQGGNYEAVYLTRTELNQSIQVKPPTELRKPGKIYHFGNYLFINEQYKGIHVIDNSNPSNPQNIKFIAIPGCVDMAVKQNILYADNAVDLVSINISNIQNIQLVRRNQNTFPPLIAPNGWQTGDPSVGIVVEWKLKN